MSVEYKSKLTIGWRVKQDEIPDFEERQDGNWLELEELAEEACELLGEVLFIENLCDIEDSWCGDTQMVGVPMFEGAMPLDKFVERIDKQAEIAKRVYKQVMREEPEDGPYFISWTQVS